MLALEAQGLDLGQRYNMPAVLLRHWYPVDPIDAMRIQYELALRFQVVEHGHLSAAHDGQLLLFERVQPADKDVRLHAAGKLTRGQCGVYVVVQIAASVGGDAGRAFSQKK